MNITSKISCFIVILSACILITVTGRRNIKNFERVQNSIEEIYKDRLVVKGLIFQLSMLIHKKETAILSENNVFYSKSNEAVNNQMDKYINQFRATYLTTKEEQTLNRFASQIKTLKNNEVILKLSNEFSANQDSIKKHIQLINNLEDDLKVLSTIQLKEGKDKLTISDKAVKSMKEVEELEKYILIVFVILVLLLFFIPGPRNNQKV